MTATATEIPAVSSKLQDIPLDDLAPHPMNRDHFDKDQLAHLQRSLAQVGQTTPAIVRPKGAKFEILAGERRWMALKTLKQATMRCEIRALDDAAAFELLIVENLQRENPHPMEEAEGYQKLIALGKLTADEVALRVGKPIEYVARRLRLLALSPAAQKLLWQDKLGLGMALSIARLPTPDAQQTALQALQRGRLESVKDLDEYIAQEIMQDLAHAPFDPADASLVKKAGSCTSCPKRTGAQGHLFPEIQKGDRCLDVDCYHSKTTALVQIAIAKATAENGGKKPVLVAGQYIEYDDRPRLKPFGKVLESYDFRRAQKAELTGPLKAKVQTGIIVYGPGVGTAIPIFAGDARHEGSTSRSSGGENRKAIAAAKARKRDQAFGQQLYAAVFAKLSSPTQMVDLAAVANVYIRRMLDDDAREMAKGLGLDKTKKAKHGRANGWRDHLANAVQEWAGEKGQPKIRAFLSVLVIEKAGEGHYWQPGLSTKRLLAAARELRVDVKAIQRGLAPKAKSHKPRGK